MPRMSAFAITLVLSPLTAMAADPIPTEVRKAETLDKRPIPEANQGIAVDGEHYYAIDNRTIGKYRKGSGELVAKFDSPKDGPFLHFDSGVVVDGRLYAAHSNYPDDPMTSSVEVFDVATMRHVDSHSFGILLGSFTWLDRRDNDEWWGTFANYNRVFGKSPLAYGNKYRTTVVRFGEAWQIAEAFVVPDELVDRFEDMSNSGGSWGPDGYLYLTGHDLGEAYAMLPPEAGSVMRWIDTVTLDIRGQGIAWDRSVAEPTLYGIVRGEGDEDNQVTVHRIPLREQRAAAP